MFSKVKLNSEKTKDTFGYYPSELNVGSHLKVVVECLNCHRLIHRECRNVNGFHQCPVVNGSQKKCFKCGLWRDLNLFNKNPKTSGGVSKMCRECYNNHPSVIKNEKNRLCRKRRAISNGDIEYYTKFRASAIKNTAKKKGIVYDIDAKHLYEIWQKQKGLCYYTTIPMKSELRQQGFQAWDAPSVDRLEPSTGYVRGNVVWCIFAVNSFKQSLNEAKFREMVNYIKWW